MRAGDIVQHIDEPGVPYMILRYSDRVRWISLTDEDLTTFEADIEVFLRNFQAVP